MFGFEPAVLRAALSPMELGLEFVREKAWEIYKDGKLVMGVHFSVDTGLSHVGLGHMTVERTLKARKNNSNS